MFQLANNSQSFEASLAQRSSASAWLLTAVLCLSVLLFCGCSTHAQRLVVPRQTFYKNNLPDAHAEFAKLASKGKGDKTVLELDLAMVEMFQGNVSSAENRLREVRNIWDDFEGKNVAEESAALVLDDQRRAYSGEDYEKVLLRYFLILASLMQDGTDAQSYALQTLQKQHELQEAARARWGHEKIAGNYCIPAVAPYMAGVLREATMRNYDDASRYYQSALSLNSQCSFIEQDIHRVHSGTHSQPGHGVLYVIALVGRGPYKVETNAEATSDALLIADRIVSVLGKYSVPPTIAPVKVPTIFSPAKPFDLIGVEVNNQPVSTTFPISDLDQLARDSYESKRTEVIARAVARRVVKKGAVYVAKDQLRAQSMAASLAMDAAGVVWEATESADTRCWGVLPREIQMLRLELPTGRHSIHLEPTINGSPISRGVVKTIDIVDGRNTYMLSYWPETLPVGEVLISK